MDRMISRKQPACAVALIVAAAFLFSGCDDGLLDDIQSETRPAAPAAPTITVGDASLTVSWTAVDNATAYDVYWHTADDSAAILPANTLASTTTSATITGLTNGTTYYVWVKARNTSGSSGFSPMVFETPGAILIEEHTPTTANAYYNDFGDFGDKNVGLGQRIVHANSYTPQNFSVWIDSIYPFKTNEGTGTPVEVILELKVWNAAKTELGHGSVTVPADYTGEVTFAIIGITVPIPGNTAIRYAVYNKTAVEDNVRGKLERDNTNGYDPHADADMISTSTAGTDLNIHLFDTYSATSTDLRFKLTGFES